MHMIYVRDEHNLITENKNVIIQEGYLVPPMPEVKAVTSDKLPKPIIFHDGRLVQKPTPLMALIILWISIGFILAVAMVNRMSMFHGTTSRGWKGMDPFNFFMNPSPAYEVTFLSKLPLELTCSSGKSSHDEVANYIQRLITATPSYECTTFARNYKYRALAGNDGTVIEKPMLKPNKVMGSIFTLFYHSKLREMNPASN